MQNEKPDYNPNQLVCSVEMAKLLSVSESWLHHDRTHPTRAARVPFIKLGASVRYHPATAIAALHSSGGNSDAN